ncbi:diaminopimelate epimerase [candidate division NPL-UPA2 bacterium]|nr:diaminopimelate epimerase [candidate division NPL-UPA2 bacterium]
MARIKFTKMCAAGNDFIIIDNREKGLSRGEADLARELCQRRFAIGADGLLLLENSSQGNDFRMRIFNPDGSEAEMCGNGARCLARFARKQGIAEERLTFETLAGQMEAEVHGEEVRLKLADPTDIKLHLHLHLDGGTHEVHYLNTGVPHIVLLRETLEDAPVDEWGRELRYHKEFAPRGANVNFIKVQDRHSLYLRTYERGVEKETLACGTGATAAAIAAFSLGQVVKPPIEVHTRGGEILKIYFDASSPMITNVYLEGKAHFIYEGELDSPAG